MQKQISLLVTGILVTGAFVGGVVLNNVSATFADVLGAKTKVEMSDKKVAKKKAKAKAIKEKTPCEPVEKAKSESKTMKTKKGKKYAEPAAGGTTVTEPTTGTSSEQTGTTVDPGVTELLESVPQ